jgi:hypothetical protein
MLGPGLGPALDPDEPRQPGQAQQPGDPEVQQLGHLVAAERRPGRGPRRRTRGGTRGKHRDRDRRFIDLVLRAQLPPRARVPRRRIEQVERGRGSPYKRRRSVRTGSGGCRPSGHAIGVIEVTRADQEIVVSAVLALAAQWRPGRPVPGGRPSRRSPLRASWRQGDVRRRSSRGATETPFLTQPRRPRVAGR